MTDNKTKEENTTHRFRRLASLAFIFLRDEKGGSASAADIRAHLEECHHDVIPPEYLEKNARGVGAWWGWMYRYTSSFVRAGFLARKGGVWRITPEEADDLSGGVEDIMQFLAKKAREYNKARQGGDATEGATDVSNAEERAQADMEVSLLYEKECMLNHILAKSADSQYAENLTAALLRALGYTAEQTPQSRDGGVDVIATTGELRVSRLFVQVKNQQSPVGEPPMRELAGVLTNKSDTDTGLFVSFSGFLPGSEKFAKSSNKHIELMDGLMFIDLWCKHYDKLPDADKALLPVKPIYFLDREKLADDTPEE